jgi:hypothetical protein
MRFRGNVAPLACDATRVVMRHDEAGWIMEVGVRTRTIRRHCDGRCIIATRAAGSQDVPSASARRITSATGRRAVLRHCRTSLCSTGPITARSTGGLPDGAGRRRELRFQKPDGRPLPEVPLPWALLTPSKNSGHSTTRLACTSARTRRGPPGQANVSTWDGPLASCTRGDSSPARNADG